MKRLVLAAALALGSSVAVGEETSPDEEMLRREISWFAIDPCATLQILDKGLHEKVGLELALAHIKALLLETYEVQAVKVLQTVRGLEIAQRLDYYHLHVKACRDAIQLMRKWEEEEKGSAG